MKRGDMFLGKISRFLIFIIFLSSCATHKIVEHEHYSYSSNVFDFYTDGSYQYLLRMEGGYVYEYSTGNWYQDGKNLILSGDTSNLLKVNMSEGKSRDQKHAMIINIKSDSNYNYSYNLDVLNQMNIDVVIDDQVFAIEEKTTVIDSIGKMEKVYFKAYPKLTRERHYEILNDTLYSRVFNYPFEETVVVKFDVKCDPIQFSQINMGNDTLKIVNRNTIKWGEIYLTR